MLILQGCSLRFQILNLQPIKYCINDTEFKLNFGVIQKVRVSVRSGQVRGEAAEGPVCALGRCAWPGLSHAPAALGPEDCRPHNRVRADLQGWWRSPPGKGVRWGLPPGQREQGLAGLGTSGLSSSASPRSGPGQCGWHSELWSLLDNYFVPA